MGFTADAVALPSPFVVRAATFGRTPKRPMDEAKFEAFYRKTARLLWSYIFRMTGNAATADFIAIAEQVSGQKLDSVFNSWLYERAMPDIPEMDLHPTQP